MIAILDNYDSFTYNLVQYLQELGADIKVFLNDQISTEKLLNYKLKGLVLSPGPGRPENAGIMNELISTVAGSIPILGVCLGYQGIAQVHGGKLEYALVMERESIPSNFTITAETDDNIVMGLEDLNKNLFGVQFHPESILTTDGKTILKNFLNTLG
jgi:anthranilate/para-aminobenzoate synthase component II